MRIVPGKAQPATTRAGSTMSYRTDGLRHRLVDSEGDKLMVWDVPGQTGYGDLVEERLQGVSSGPSLDFSAAENSQYTPLF